MMSLPPRSKEEKKSIPDLRMEKWGAEQGMVTVQGELGGRGCEASWYDRSIR